MEHPNAFKNPKAISSIALLLFSLSVVFSVSQVITGEKFSLNRNVLKKAGDKFGGEAVNRLLSWEALINSDSLTTDMQKLEEVNSFFNKMIYFANDIEVWGVNEYWATPVEFLCKCSGDCEDFAIAKYFSLKMMGVAESKLRIAYVKALRQNMTHMVMAYYSSPSAEPLILDNLVDSINPASKRTDLLPIFTFNGTGLWLAKERGQGKLAGSPSRLTAWTELQKRMLEDNL